MLDFGKIVLSMKDERILEALVRREEERFQKENKREWIGILLSNVLSFMAVIISLIALLK